MKQISKKTILILTGIIIGAGFSIFAASWQGTYWIRNGSVISAEKMKANFDYLYNNISNSLWKTEGNNTIRTDKKVNIIVSGGFPNGWGGGVHTWDLYANGGIGAGKNGNVATFMSSNGLMFARKIGVNNPNPKKALDVTGDINFTGDLYKNGAKISLSGSGCGKPYFEFKNCREYFSKEIQACDFRICNKCGCDSWNPQGDTNGWHGAAQTQMLRVKAGY